MSPTSLGGMADLSAAYERMRFRVTLAEDQVDDFAELLAKWFVDSNEGARDWLREIALAHREEMAKAAANRAMVSKDEPA